MNMISYARLIELTVPEIFLAVTMLLVLAVDLTVGRPWTLIRRRVVAACITCLGCGAAILWLGLGAGVPDASEIGWAMDPLTRMIKQIILVLTVATAVIALESEFTHHVGEYFALLLLGTLGLLCLTSAMDLLLIFISLELTSLSLYILTAFHKQARSSVEAALKYFLFGAVAAAFMLFGLSWIYGITGQTQLGQVASQLAGHTQEPMVLAALVMVLIGFGFKVAAAPFHLWAPDAYQGAPTPSAAFIASGSKVAGFFVLAKVMLLGFAGAAGSGSWRAFAAGWMPVLAVMALISMGLGNLAALAQTGVKRLLAYSAIAHAGYILVGLLAGNAQGLAAVVYYVVTYALTVVGAFGVVAVVVERTGSDSMTAFAGLSRRAPWLSLFMLVFLLSLAGIPPLAGFFGKFFLFAAALRSTSANLGLLWLVILALGFSVVSLYYYLQVLKQIYVADPAADAVTVRPLGSTQVILGGLAVMVVLLGAMPGAFLTRLQSAIQAAGF